MLWLLTEWGGYRMKKRALRKENESVSVKDLSAVLKNELNAELAAERDDLFLYRIVYDSSCENRTGNTLAAVLEFFERNISARFDFSLLLTEEKDRSVSPSVMLEKLKNRLFLFKERNTLFIDRNISFPYEDFFQGRFSGDIFAAEKGENGWMIHGSLDSDFRAFNREAGNLFSAWSESADDSLQAVEIYGGFPFLLRNWIREHWEQSFDIRCVSSESEFFPKKGRRKTIYLISVYDTAQKERLLRFAESGTIDKKREIPVLLHSGTKPLFPPSTTISLHASFADPSRWEREMIHIFTAVTAVKDFLEIAQIPRLLKQIGSFPAEKIDFCVKTALLFGFWDLEPADKADFLHFVASLNREIFESKKEFFTELNRLIFSMFESGEILYPEAYAAYLLKQEDDPDRYCKILVIIKTLLRNLRITEADIVLDLPIDDAAALSDDTDRPLLEETLLLGRFYRACAAFDLPSLRLLGEKILKLPNSGNLKIDFEQKTAAAVCHFMFFRMEEAVNVSKDLLFRVNEIFGDEKKQYKALGNYLIAAAMFGMEKLYEGSCYLNFLFDAEKSEETHSAYYIQARLLKAASLYISGQFGDLEDFFSSPHEIFTESLFCNRFFYRFLQSRFYFDLGRYRQAEEILISLIKDCATAKLASPEETVAVLQAWVGRIYVYNRQKEKAARCFAALPADSADAFFFQAENALFDGNPDEALKFLTAARKALKPPEALSVDLMSLKPFRSGFESVEDLFYFHNFRKPFLSRYIDFSDNLLRALNGEDGALLNLSKFIRMQFIQKPEPNFIFFLYSNTLALRFFAREHGDEINEDTLSAKIQLLFYEKKFFTSKASVCKEFLNHNFHTRFLKIDGNKFK